MPVKKIIPCLDIKDGRVVKGVHFVNIKDAADPAEAASTYEKQGADEIAFLDIAATTEKRKTKISWVKRVSKVINIPLTVGGGIKDLSDLETLLEAGASKISINTAAVKNPHLIEEASEKFGKESIIIAIDGKESNKTKSGFEVYVEGGGKATGIDVVEWAKKAEELGAGELLVTSINADGTKKGYALEFTKKIAENVKIPVIASGGAGKLEDIYLVLTEGGADAALAASIFHFRLYTVREVKEYLKRKGVQVNL